MPLSRTQKSELLEELRYGMKEAKCVLFAKFHGVSVKNTDELRNELRNAGASYKVIKKTLIKLVSKEFGIEDIPENYFDGPVSVVFSMEDELAGAKILHKFSKDNSGLSILGAYFQRKLLSAKDANNLATLPSKEELLTKFVYILKSPISGFHGVLNNTISSFVRALGAIKEKQSV